MESSLVDGLRWYCPVDGCAFMESWTAGVRSVVRFKRPFWSYVHNSSKSNYGMAPAMHWKPDTMARTNPFTFLQQVRSETEKVTWPSRRETMISTIMVLVMVLIASLFFFAVDQFYGWGFDLIFGPTRS
jgi:preprotein translocase subunit SecE